MHCGSQINIVKRVAQTSPLANITNWDHYQVVEDNNFVIKSDSEITICYLDATEIGRSDSDTIDCILLKPTTEIFNNISCW